MTTSPDIDAPDRRAKWITSSAWVEDPGGGLPVLALAFDVPAGVASAVLRIAGLGVFSAKINGSPVSGDLLEPGYTDYAIRAEYCTYPVAELLQPGANILVVELGPGMYRSQSLDDRWVKIHTDYGDLAACATLDWVTADGECGAVITDESWHGTTGATLRSSWTGGEDFDASAAPSISVDAIAMWRNAVTATVPRSMMLTAKAIPPLRVIERLGCVSVDSRGGGVHVIDFGVNFAGWVELDLPARVDVVLRPAELLDADGGINASTQGWGPVRHRVTTAEAPISWHPQFMYNGLRYLEISGLESAPTPASLRGLVIAADAPAVGSLVTSSDRVNDVHRIIHRAITSNMYSMFTDCPQREKLGYLEQLHLVYPILAQAYDVQALLENSLRIMREAQEESGRLGLFVPEWNRFPDPWRGDPNFGGAIVFLPWQLYRTYGSIAVLQDNYSAMARYARYLLDSRVDGLLEYGLGDWNGRDFSHVSFVTTATLHRMVQTLGGIAALLGEVEDERAWGDVAARVHAAIDVRFLREDGSYGDGSVAEAVVAVNSGIVPAEASAALVDRLEAIIVASGYYLDIGEVAMAALVPVLARFDRHETLFRLIEVDEKPSYGYMLRHGATALTETWDGPTYGYSQNHFMNGAIDAWFVEHLAGIQQDDDSTGYRRIVIRPRPCGDLVAADATYRSPAGLIGSSWTLENGSFELRVEIPVGATARVCLPNGGCFDVGPGSHSFSADGL